MKRYIGWLLCVPLVVAVARWPWLLLIVVPVAAIYWIYIQVQFSDDQILSVIGSDQWKSTMKIRHDLERLRPAPSWKNGVGLPMIYARLHVLEREGLLASRTVMPQPEILAIRGGRQVVEYRLTGSNSPGHVEAERLQPEIDTDLITIN